jgi:hypothetical protein
MNNTDRPPFWEIIPSLAVTRRVEELMDRRPPSFDVQVRSYLTGEQKQFVRENAIDPSTGLKKPYPLGIFDLRSKLIIRDANFNFDYIGQSGLFCSSKLRSIIRDDGDIVQYIPVDDHESSEIVISKHYMSLHVLAYSSVLDADKSTLVRMPFDEFGDPGPERVIAARRVVFQEGVTSRFPIFRDPLDSRIFVTEDFASVVCSSGVTGVDFLDVRAAATWSDDLPLRRNFHDNRSS